MSCPNTNLPEWKLLVASRGEDVAYALWDLYEGNVPESESRSEIVKSGLKATNILQSPKADQFFNAVAKNKITGDFFWRKMQADLGIPKDQLEILKSFNTQDRGELISSLLGNYSFAIEINIANEKRNAFDDYTESTGWEYKPLKNQQGNYDGRMQGIHTDGRTTPIFNKIEDLDNYLQNKESDLTIPTQYYSNLTVPGGTNYTENEIATPAITPSIKGHAQFATDQGIGWFRSDDKLDNAKTAFDLGADEFIETEAGQRMDPKNYTVAETGTPTKTRRILEVQSDLFQKGRDKENLDKNRIERIQPDPLFPSADSGNILPNTTSNQFLQLLNQGSNWVTFFVKSIIQDYAKKGYEKVLFPSGKTIGKIEGFGKVEEEIQELNDKLKKIPKANTIQELKDIVTSVGKSGGNLETEKEWHIKKTNDELNHYLAAQKDTLSTINFYENTVANVLKKQGFSPKQVTDEFGNTWNEVEIVPEREEQTILFQTEEMPASKASAQTVSVMRAVAKQMDVDIQSLEDYAKGNPDIQTKGVNGLADLVKGVIAIAQGKENYAITEEVVHIATAIIEQTNPRLVTEMISKINRFKIYDETLKAYKGKKAYQLSNGKPDIRKIKKEAVDKLIAELIINESEGSTQFPELMYEADRSMIQKWWDAILDFIKGQYRKSNIDIFQQTSSRVLSGKVGGIVSDITNGGIFYQVKSTVVDKLYNIIKDFDKRIKLNLETTDAAGKVIPRHYIIDGLPEQIPGVTAKLK